MEFCLGGLNTLEVLLHHVVIGLSDGLEQHRAVLISLILKIGRDVDDVVGLTLLGVFWPDQSLHADEIDNPAEVGLGTNRNLQHEGGCVEALADHPHAHVEIGTGAIELVDKADTRHVVAVCLTPHGLGLGLDTGHAIEHCDSSVENAK